MVFLSYIYLPQERRNWYRVLFLLSLGFFPLSSQTQSTSALFQISPLLCMAAVNFKGRAIAVRFGKRLLNQIWWTAPPSATLSSPALLSSRAKAVHVSSYDKNVEEHVRPTVLPDHVIDAKSDKYWGPHPTTGVFGPADVGSAEAAGGGAKPAAATGSSSSALDQTVWFRPHEVDKAPVA